MELQTYSTILSTWSSDPKNPDTSEDEENTPEALV